MNKHQRDDVDSRTSSCSKRRLQREGVDVGTHAQVQEEATIVFLDTWKLFKFNLVGASSQEILCQKEVKMHSIVHTVEEKFDLRIYSTPSAQFV